ncbi:LytR/AlgR family response regulator transcription factor [Hufsiella ginkgonis]|uniref:HTH LytTR-type domain-containing protein n=1 Tax=Hufsiella ginkgonis TaxID=2695274 RepID=A0A7K1XTK3_9SPHI|nr:LytTR family DNA-binding domain-containing protein [Hufsiella ginkgonis]MXV14335.1 hypothetical protein [Hufsiella ginkgonis]
MKGKVVRIPIEEIVYIEAAQNYLLIHLERDEYLTYLTMKEIEAVLDPACFIRIHKSYIINFNMIRSVEGGAVILTNKTALLIGAKFRTNLDQQILPRLLQSKRLEGDN